MGIQLDDLNLSAGRENIEAHAIHKSPQHPIAMIQLKYDRDISMCIEPSILSSDSVPCIAFDSDLFPNFFTITSCFGQDKRRQQIYNNQNYCYSSDPKTN